MQKAIQIFAARKGKRILKVQPFKKKLRAALNPDAVGEDDYDLVMARRAIREFSQATSDVEAIADLMIYAVECGNRFTLDGGDIGEDFYDGLIDIYAAAIKKVLKLPKDVQGIYRKRLEKIMESSDGIGWGYHDGLCAHFDKAFPIKNSHFEKAEKIRPAVTRQ